MLLLVLLGVCQGQDQPAEFSDSEMQETNSEFNQCVVQLEYQFEERKDTAEDETEVEVGTEGVSYRYFTLHLTSSRKT